jgi:CO dehydrogenase nickel-insertion accessory protein CooC1
VAERAGQLSRELGIRRVRLVVNRHIRKLEHKLDDIIASGIFDAVHRLPLDASILEHDPDIGPVINGGGPYAQAVEDLLTAIREDR